jgi:hypothetical protein
MGGLIVRSALTFWSQNLTRAGVQVEDVVTGGSPHNGAAAARAMCDTQLFMRKVLFTGASDLTYQCKQLLPSDSTAGQLLAFLNYCDGSSCPRTLPRSYDWTLLGSDADTLVTAASATYPSAQHAITLGGLSHFDYFANEASVRLTKSALADSEH